MRRVISARRALQVAFGVGLYLLVTHFGISLWWVVLGASVLGIILGKFFCRWMCPMGAIMETLLGAGSDADRHKRLYMYFKLGCPIAWAGGLLNKISLLRVRVDRSRCTDCARCDRACYVAQLAPSHSLHASGVPNASTHYSCSRCLGCVSACPTGALSVGWVPLPRLRASSGRQLPPAPQA